MPTVFTRPIIALAVFDFGSLWATLTWLNPNSLPQLSSMRLFLFFIAVAF